MASFAGRGRARGQLGAQGLIITDSIQATEAVQKAPNIEILTVAPLIGEAIARTANEESVSSLFD